MIILQALASLALRFALALPFWNSGLTRWEGFLKLRDATLYLYANEYKPTILGKTYAMPYPEIAAWVGSFAEIVLGAVVAATWLYQGFVLGIVAYLYAFFAAVVAILLTLAVVAYLNGWFGVRVTGGPRPLAGKPL